MARRRCCAASRRRPRWPRRRTRPSACRRRGGGRYARWQPRSRTGGYISTQARTGPRPRHGCVELPGIGPWTAQYVALRALGDPDVLLPTDLGVRRGAAALGLPDDPVALASHARDWAPWRSYATIRLWRHA